MKLIIDIPEKDWEFIKETDGCRWSRKILDGVINGTPLPKGHGRLIDADDIEYTHEVARSLDDGHNWNELCVTKDEIEDAPTIIEADEGE